MVAIGERGMLGGMLTADLSWGELNELERAGATTLRVQWATSGPNGVACSWQPSVNIYRAASDCLVCVELAGVPPDSMQLRVEPDRLVVRGRRLPPEPDGGATRQVLAMEIDHGRFEREIRFPFAVDPAAVEARHDNGLVWIRLPVVSEA
jgi:HSP20 family protein